MGHQARGQIWGWPGRSGPDSLLTVPGPLHPAVSEALPLDLSHIQHPTSPTTAALAPALPRLSISSTAVQQSPRPDISTTLTCPSPTSPHPPQCLHLLSPLISCRDPYISLFGGLPLTSLRSSRSQTPHAPAKLDLLFPSTPGAPHSAKPFSNSNCQVLFSHKSPSPMPPPLVTLSTGLTPSEKGGLSHRHRSLQDSWNRPPPE